MITIIEKEYQPSTGYRLDESIRYPVNGALTFEFLATDDDETTIGRIVVDEGYIVDFTFQEDIPHSKKVNLVNMLISRVISEADNAMSNLLVQLDEDTKGEIKNTLQRYGFNHIKDGVYRRRHGSIVPPLVKF